MQSSGVLSFNKLIVSLPTLFISAVSAAAPAGSHRHGNINPAPTGPMRVDTWFSPPPSSASTDNASSLKPDTRTAEEIIVYGHGHKRDDDWRLDLVAKAPQYEASNSDAAQPLVPYPSYTTLDQQRMMSEKTDALGWCGALWGYVQCPELPP